MKPIFLVLISLSLIVGCSKKQAPPPSHKVAVSLGEVTKEDIPFVVTAIGQLVASIEVNIASQVGGYLTAALFQDGQLVEEGDLLFIIEQPPYQAALNKARAQLVEAKARYKYAQQFADTYGSLVDEEFVSRLKYEQGIQNVGVALGAIESAEAAIKTAEINFGHTEIRSPTKGYISNNFFDVGNLISAGSTKPLTTVRKVVPIDVHFSIPSKFVERIRNEQKKHPLFFQCIRPGEEDHPLSGSVYFINNVINENTGMIALKGTIPNEDERGWPGQFVRVYLQISTFQDAIVVPQAAVIPGQDMEFVYTTTKDKEGALKAQLRKVKTGRTFEGMTIIEWGLKPGEQVIVDGHGNVWNGAEIFVPEHTTKVATPKKEPAKSSDIDKVKKEAKKLKDETTHTKKT